jgi:prevent-host-death family protein
LSVKTVPLQDLKRRLSGLVSAAEAGETIVVTRHGRAVAVLSSAAERHLVVGPRAGKDSLEPLFARPATKGRYLAALDADRGDERDGR